MKIVIGVALVAAAAFLGPFGAIGYSIFGFGSLATSFAVAAASLGASMILGGISEKLQGDIQHGQAANVAIRQAAAPWQIVYGRARIGGIIAYINVTNKQDLHMVILHAAHPCYAINGYWLDGRQVVFSGGGQSGTADSSDHTDPNGNTYNFRGEVYVANRLGTEASAAFPELTAYDSNWNSACILRGHCCSYIRCRWDQNLWPNGYPAIKIDIAGKSNIYDPRDGTYKYTENSALCIADVLVNQDWGLQCNYSEEIDEPYLIAAANLCDERVTLATGGSEPRYSTNGTFDSSLAPGNIIDNMLASCAGRNTCSGGLWRILPGAYVVPTVSFNDDDVIGPIKWMPKRKYRDLVNGVRGRFICPTFPYTSTGPGFANNEKVGGIFDGQWQACDVPYYAQDSLHGYGAQQKINCGGANAGGFLADTGFSGGTPGTLVHSLDRSLVSGTSSPIDEVLLCLRNGSSFTYTLTVNPNELVVVRLWFIENFWTTSGARMFNVDIQGSRVLTNYDIFADTGAQYRPFFHNFSATADASGHVVVAFTSGAADLPQVSAIEVFPQVPDANLAADNNTRLWQDVNLPYTISVAEAQRALKIYLLRNRRQGTGTIQVNLKGLQVSALDTIQITHSRFGWTNKTFEVTAWRLQIQDGQDGEGPLAYIEMDIAETDSGVYSWSTSEELSIEDNPSPVAPGAGTITQAVLPPISTGNRNSSIVGGVSPLTASDVGTSVDISVAAWALQTGAKQVSYSSGVIHGAAYTTRYYIYCSDSRLQGGAVTYAATTNFSVVTSDQSFVYVDQIVTPASGGSSTGGTGTGGGGTGGGTNRGNESGSITLGSVTGSPPNFSRPVSWTATNVPSGNAIAFQVMQSGAGGFWSNIGTTVSGSTSYSWNAIDGTPQYRLIDTSNGFTLYGPTSG